MKAFLLIVIDQLRYDEHQFFPKLGASLGAPQKYRTDVFPTLTESVHASIATGSLPGAHGVIGDEWFEEDGSYRCISTRKARRDPFLDAPSAGRLIGRALAARGVDCFVVAGKEKVADIMAPPAFRPRGAVVASYRSERDNRYHLHIDDCRRSTEFARDLPEEAVAEGAFHNLRDPAIDMALVGVMTHLIEKHRSDDETPLFAFVGFHRLDVIGHRQRRATLGPVFASIDAATDLLVRRFQEHFIDSRIVVTADHGVRPVDRCVVYSDEAGGFIEIRGTDVLDLRSPVGSPRGDGHVMDGGTLRAWNPPERLSRVERALGAFNCTAPFRSMRDVHPRWGDRVAEASLDVGLAKPDWLGDIDLVAKSVSRPIIAEHGTASPEDAEVPWWCSGGGTGVGSHEGLRDELVAFFADELTA